MSTTTAAAAALVVDEVALKARYEKAGQDHVFETVTDLSTDEKDAFYQQLHAIQVEDLHGLLQAALADQQQQQQATNETITPFSKPVGRFRKANEGEDVVYEQGLDAIRKGQVAALVLAGGQGTRLGFSGPKGMYDIGMPSKKTLFQLICERLQKVQQLAAGASASTTKPSLPFYIMTSPINHQETVAFFESNDYFGLSKSDVCLFEQGMLPCLTPEGKIMLESASKVAMAPDGNGGIYPSLHKSGMLADMEKRGIQYLHVFSIDNALTKPADPTFMGYCISQGADCGNKVVWKANAHEKVGVIAEKAGKACVVEYSDITKDMAEATDAETGRLQFGAGNICNHFYTLDFIQQKILPNLGNMYHIARKKIPTYDKATKQTVKPESNNGIKLESFIFDVFPMSESMAVLDVLREDEFAPVKNAPGSASDCPDTARQYLSNLAKRWIRAAGGEIEEGSENDICEISPLTSFGGEGLSDLVQQTKKRKCPFSL